MTKAVAHFGSELDALVNWFRFEYDITYAEMVGCLQILTFSLLTEANEEEKQKDLGVWSTPACSD